MVVYLRESNKTKVRKFILDLVRGALLYYQVDDQGYKSSKDRYNDFFLFFSPFPFFPVHAIYYNLWHHPHHKRVG